jgi:CubicO group peptidase (beta-lactamase class C family)
MRATWRSAALAALIATGAHASPPPTQTGPAPTVPTFAPKASATAKPVSAQSATAHALTEADAEAYLDGFFQDSLARADIAGAVVVVVKDGRVLLEKGYGFSDVTSRASVDPRRTLFRPGSISKLFTWTAVMQLVEQGKLDLDRDVNDYLDFRIPSTWPKPITLRSLMTHTPGFEEHIKGLMVDDPKEIVPLRSALLTSLPKRIYPPGQVSAYSNYGASLAGYIVQRISGEPFADYIAHHILKPLGMTHSTFEQPLPKALQADMSKGYFTPEEKPQPFEIINLSPAGALSTDGDDIAHFMIAHLNNGSYEGASILKPETIALMHRPAFQPVPPLPAMALGFYHEDRNGHAIVGHGGDSQVFHSDLHLILDANVGLFLSMNSAGKDMNPVSNVRTMLLDGFMNRYFPAPEPRAAKALPSAKADAEKVAGFYRLSRRSETNFASLGSLVQSAEVAVLPDGAITIPLLAAAGGPKKWIEVAPFIWREEHGSHRLAVVMEGGKVKWASSDLFPPILVLQPVPLWLTPTFVYVLLGASLSMLLLTTLFWPIKAVLRWRYGQAFAPSGWAAGLYRWTRIVALIDIVMIGGWLAFLLSGQFHLDVFSSKNDVYVRILQLLSVLAVAGSVVPILQFIFALRDRSQPWWTKATDGMNAVSAISIAWFVFAFRLVTLSLNY